MHIHADYGGLMVIMVISFGLSEVRIVAWFGLFSLVDAGVGAVMLSTRLLWIVTVDLLARIDDLLFPVALRTVLRILGRWQRRDASRTAARNIDRGTRSLLRLGLNTQIISGRPAAKRPLLLLDDAGPGSAACTSGASVFLKPLVRLELLFLPWALLKIFILSFMMFGSLVLCLSFMDLECLEFVLLGAVRLIWDVTFTASQLMFDWFSIFYCPRKCLVWAVAWAAGITRQGKIIARNMSGYREASSAGNILGYFPLKRPSPVP